MFRPHLTLYGQILFWFFLNLALVAAVLFFVLNLQFRVDPGQLLGGRTREQFRAASSVMSGELRNAPRGEWEEILKRYAGFYGVRMALYRPEGQRLWNGEDLKLPDELLREAAKRPARRARPGGATLPLRRTEEGRQARRTNPGGGSQEEGRFLHRSRVEDGALEGVRIDPDANTVRPGDRRQRLPGPRGLIEEPDAQIIYLGKAGSPKKQ